MDKHEWDQESPRRIRRFFCTLYHNGEITVKDAQKIMGEMQNANHLIQSLVDSQGLVEHGGKFRFTPEGQQTFFDVLIEENELNRLDEPAVISFVDDYARNLVKS